MVSYILEHSLGCTVVKKNIDEQTSWQGFPTGEVDAILENWGHEDLAAKYITTDKVAQDAGQTGNEGIIGWYVPKFFADANPDILTASTDPKVLNKYADQFKTSESGDKGQILDGDPSFVTNDQGMINGFGLNYKVVYSGSEAASNKAIQSAIDQKKPILAYYYTPNWFSAKVDLVHIVPGGHRRLRQGPDQDRLRLSAVPPQQGRLDEVRDERQPRLHPHQELQLDQRRPEPGRRLHHRSENMTDRRPRSGSTPTPPSGVIALPRDWCNYGAILDGFTAKYGIKINSINPDGGSGDELTAITANKGSTGPSAPDVVDVGLAFGPQAKSTRA